MQAWDLLAAVLRALGQKLGDGRPKEGTHLSKPGHGFTGDDVIVVQPGDKAEGLDLTLTLLQLPQDQGPEDLHILMEKGRTGTRWMWVGPPCQPTQCPAQALERTCAWILPCKRHLPLFGLVFLIFPINQSLKRI